VKLLFFLVGLLIPLLFVSPVRAETQNVCIQDYPTVTQVMELVDSGALYLMQTGNCMSNSTYPLPTVAYQYNPGTVAIWQRWECSTSSARWKYYGWSNSGTHTNDDCYDVDVALLPAPPEPDHCNNLVADGDETGVNCGGSCIAPDNTCTPYCPTGGDYVLSDNGDGTYNCDAVFAVNSLGLCQAGQTLSPGGVDGNGDPVADECLASVSAVMASDDYNDPVPVPVYQPDYSLQTDQVTQSTTNVATVDNLDGTSTVTETTITTTSVNDSSSPSKVTTNTITRIIDNTSGGTLSEVTSTNTSENNDDPADPLDPGTFVGGAGHDPSAVLVEESVLDQFTTRFEAFRTAIEDAPIYTPVSNFFSAPDTTGKTSTLTIGMGSYGDAGFDLADYGNIWDKLGLIFLFLAGWSAMRRILGDGMRSNHV